MRVPSPAARMTTVGADTARIVVSGSRADVAALGGRPKAGLWVLVPAIPVRIRAPQLACRSIRPASMRTYVRAALHGRGTARGRRRGRHDDRGAPPFRPAAGRRQPQAAAALARGVGRSRPSTSTRSAAAARRERRSRSRTMLVERSTYQRAQLKQRLYDAGLKTRACELCGQGEEWRGQRDVADPRPHQRRRRRQPAREPPDRLPELRGDAGHALRPRGTVRPSRTGRACTAARAFRPSYREQRYCSRRCGMRWHARARPIAGRAAGGAAAVRAAGRGGGGGGLERGRAQVRRERQRGAQVGARVRARTRRAERERARSKSFVRQVSIGLRRPPRLARLHAPRSRSPPRSRPCSCPPLRPSRAIRRCRCGRSAPGCSAPDTR